MLPNARGRETNIRPGPAEGSSPFAKTIGKIIMPEKSFFDSMDFLSNNVLLPFGGILISLFVGWRLKPEILLDQLPEMPQVFLGLLIFSLRFIAPGAIFLVFAMSFLK